MTEDDYRDAVTAKGYDAPSQKKLAPRYATETHTHDYALFLYIQDGEITVNVEDDGNVSATTCGVGDTIEVPAGTVHSERIGDRGVTILVAKK